MDYGALFTGPTADTVTDPQQLFQALPNKAKKYNYLRVVQGDVLSRWYASDEFQDTVIKMNTGGGKTTVGLLVAKSSLNEGLGNSIYLCPDNYLSSQASAEAKNLGLRYTHDPRAADFLAGKSILICTVQTLFNGLSKFGVGRDIEIEIGTIVIDDAHACLAIIEDQYTISLPRASAGYGELLHVFEEDLRSQSVSSLFDLKVGDSRGFMQVPYWAWLDKQDDVIRKNLDEDQKLFKWPLIKGSLSTCRCYFNSKRLEISGRCLPADVIPSFIKAKRRIYLTATLSDDSILVTAFGSAPEQVASPVTPKTASDLGERMILAPQQINLNVTDEDIRSFVALYAKTENVVVIVPSGERAKFWQSVASKDLILTAENLEAGVKILRSSKGHLAVLVNKYDGIDLPDEACRILVLDGLPDTRRLIDKYEQGTLASSERFRSRQMQRIEQGMGRGIRSNEDYCVIILMGPQLLKVLYAAAALKHLSPATRKQLELSRQLASQVERKGLDALKDPINDVLSRNSAWVAASKNNLIDVTYPAVKLDEASLAQRKAFDAKRINRHEAAFQALQKCADNSADDFVRGWLLDQAAEALHPVDKVRSQTVLLSANAKNYAVTKPLKGLGYKKLSVATDQAREASTFLSTRYVEGGNNIVLAMNGLLDDLTFKLEGSEAFEVALQELGHHLGFKAQRPEKEGGGKLDVLWALGKLRNAMFACKSEAQNPAIPKQYADQVSGNVNWFNAEYGADCIGTPIVVHPANVFASDASPPPSTRVLDNKGLKAFKAACAGYASAIKTRVDEPEFIKNTLIAYDLSGEKIVNKFTVAMKQKH